jgi:hypothetical protein
MDKSERLLNELLKIPVNTICCDCGAASKNLSFLSIPFFAKCPFSNKSSLELRRVAEYRYPPLLSIFLFFSTLRFLYSKV